MTVRQRISLVLVCLAILLWVGCPQEVLDYVGEWEDAATLSPVVTVTLDFDADAATITIDYADPGEDDIVIEGTLKKSGSTLTATITKITVGSTEYTNDPLPMLDAFLAALTPPLTTVNTFTYSVTGDTLTITGDLIGALTGGFTTTLTATRT